MHNEKGMEVRFKFTYSEYRPFNISNAARNAMASPPAGRPARSLSFHA